jgi:small subunit ribosomal protein S4
MARYKGSVCKLCRREKTKLFLKGDRCYTDKCALERRESIPGQHGAVPKRRMSEYGLQLREKQKVRRIYGIMEKQFRNYFLKGERKKGITGENLLQALERRLDNVIYRLGFAPSRRTARQLVRHGHFQVNGRKVNIPSYQVKPKDVVRVRKKSRDLAIIHDSLKASERMVRLSWLRVDKAKLEGEVLDLPTREQIPEPITEKLIVELYSK